MLAAQMCILTLRQKTTAPITVVGNVGPDEATRLRALGAVYIDERDINVSGRLPSLASPTKYREPGWYRQMFFRLSVDRFVDTAQAVILDSEVFVFDNWDETRLYDPASGHPRGFFWVPSQRKPEWDYRMYRGAAYLLQTLPGCAGVLDYANSDGYHRHISGVVLFSTANVAELWRRLENETDLERNLDQLFNHEPDLAFSDHDLYGLAAEYGLFDTVVPTVQHENLLGWYDNHDDPRFHRFRQGAMWSMCQRYAEFPTPREYRTYMESTATSLGARLPNAPYWNPPDRELIALAPIAGTIDYLDSYRAQLDHTHRTRWATFTGALRLLASNGPPDPTIVEIGTLRDSTKGGGHATYKFGEFCSRFGGTLHTVDISEAAIEHSMRASSEFQPWIRYHQEDSEAFLKAFDGTIDLLYLDGLDSLPGDEDIASQKQLAEIEVALPHLAPECLVLLDDADLPLRGKTRLSAPFLLEHGFVLHIDGYQQLYVRGLGVPTPAGSPARWRRLLARAGGRRHRAG
jgi:Methyltransferase domain